MGVYTLVHCCDDMDQAAQYGLWESVEWWYRHLAEFTLEWELPNLPAEEQEKFFPLLKLRAENPMDIQAYQDQDMIIVGTPEMCLEKVLKYEAVGVDQLLCYMQFGMLPHELDHAQHRAAGHPRHPRARASRSPGGRDGQRLARTRPWT